MQHATDRNTMTAPHAAAGMPIAGTTPNAVADPKGIDRMSMSSGTVSPRGTFLQKESGSAGVLVAEPATTRAGRRTPW